MKNIKVSDLKLVKKVIKPKKVKIWKPLFLGMKEKDIYRIDKTSNNYVFGYNKKGEEVYFENSDGYWSKREYKYGEEISYEDSDGYWHKREYKNGKEVYYENSNGYWSKRDDNNNMIEFKNGKYYLNGKEAELKK